MVERKTAFMMMEKLPSGKNAQELAKVVIRLMFAYKEKVHTMTSDNGRTSKNCSKIENRVFFHKPLCVMGKGVDRKH